MKTKRESLVFYRSFYEAIDDLPAEMYKKACRSVLAYAFDSEEPAFDGEDLDMAVAKIVFTFMRPLLDANARRYDAAVARRKKKPGIGEEPSGIENGPTDGDRPPQGPATGNAAGRGGKNPVIENGTPGDGDPEPPGASDKKTVPTDKGGGQTDGGTDLPGLPVKKEAESPPVPPPESPPVPLPPKQWPPAKKHVAELHAECAGQDEWLRVVEMKNSMRPGEGRDWLRGFAMHLISSGRAEETEQEFKRYFANWTASEIRKGHRPINSAPPGSGQEMKIGRMTLGTFMENSTGWTAGPLPEEAVPAMAWGPPAMAG